MLTVLISVSHSDIWITGNQCQSIRGIVSDVYDAGPDITAVTFSHDETVYYLRTGTETIRTVNNLKQKLVGKEAVIFYTDDSAPLPIFNRNTRHIIQITVNGEKISIKSLQ